MLLTGPPPPRQVKTCLTWTSLYSPLAPYFTQGINGVFTETGTLTGNKCVVWYCVEAFTLMLIYMRAKWNFFFELCRCSMWTLYWILYELIRSDVAFTQIWMKHYTLMAYSHCRIRTRIPTRTRIPVLCRNFTLVRIWTLIPWLKCME